MNKYNVFLGLIMLLLFIPIVSAECLPHKQNNNLCFSITSNNATECNVSSFEYPSGVVFIEQVMTKNGRTFNASIDSGNFTSIGTYGFNIICTDGVNYETGSICREVTPSGSQINSGKAIGLFGSLVLMIIVAIVFLVFAFKSENMVAKISFYCFSAIGFIMAILYTVIVMQQTLFGFDSILTGIESFWFVGKMLVGVGILALGIIIFLIMLKAWKIKRGIYDLD